MADDRKSNPSDKGISITGDVKDSVVITGDHNTTFFQKIINIFKSDVETLEQRNRRILLNHVENAWIKGVLEVFDSIGMGRSLLILGAPGSGKTTMLLELARGLIARA